jgi:hypothetical protein
MFLFFAVWLNIFLHPVSVSVTNMDIDAQKRSIELSIKLFAHDLETVLHNKHDIHSWIGTQYEHPDSRRLLKDYVNDKFTVAVNNGEKIELITDSVTLIDDAMMFYMKGKANQTINSVEIDNRLLTDYFADQTNLVIINNGSRDFAYILNRRNHNIELSL